MHTNQTYNYLSIDNAFEILPFSDEVKNLLPHSNMDDAKWNAYGLPAFHCTFSLTSKQLYFESSPDGKMKIEKSEFSGVVLVSALVVPIEGDSVYNVVFELLFQKGILISTEPKEEKKIPKEEYEKGFEVFCKENDKRLKVMSSYWFRYLYIPYYFTVTYSVAAIVFIVELPLRLLVFLTEKILPFKL